MESIISIEEEVVPNLPKRLIDAVVIGDESTSVLKLLEEYCSKYSASMEPDVLDGTVAMNEGYNRVIAQVRDLDGNNLLHLAILHLFCRGNNPRLQRQGNTEGDPQAPKSIQRKNAQRRTHTGIEKPNEILELFLTNPEYRIDPCLTNYYGESALHKFHSAHNQVPQGYAPIQTRSKTKDGRDIHKAGVDLFFQHVLDNANDDDHTKMLDLVNATDINGYTSLHNAVKRKCTYCIGRLRNLDAKLNIKSGNTYFPFVTPQIFMFDERVCFNMEPKLDAAITQNETDDKDNDERTNDHGDSSDVPKAGISMNFCHIVPHTAVTSEHPEREMEFIETFLEADSEVTRKILSHPLVSGFVYLKWKRIQKLYFASFFIHIGLAILYTGYIWKVYLQACPYHILFKNMENSTDTWRKCDERGFKFASTELIFSIGLMAVGGILAFLELVKIYRMGKSYIQKEWHNVFQVLMIGSLFASVFPSDGLYRWQYSIAAFGIFHVWSTLMINVGRFPTLGIFIQMFARVLENFGKLMLVYGSLFIAFTIAFCVVFPEQAPFKNSMDLPLRATLKVITMMSGEVDYSEFFNDDHKSGEPSSALADGSLLHPFTGRVLYGSFVILITIVLMNLLVGLAVDDIKALRLNAEYTRTIREISNISYMEALIFWNQLPNWWIVRMFRKGIVVAQFNADKTRRAKRKGSSFWSFLENTFCFKTKSTTGQQFPSLDSEDNRDTQLRDMNLAGNEERSKCTECEDKYNFIITPDDCKKSKNFPEEIYEKAMAKIKKRNGATSDTGRTHCKTCTCLIECVNE